MEVLNCISFLVFNLCLLIALSNGSNADERKPYIVYMGDLPEDTDFLLDDHHHSLLSEAIGDEAIAKESKIHSYTRSFNAFAARLLPDEAERLSQKEGIISVFPNTVRKLRTTRSWDFIGMPETVQRNHQVESNTIVAVLDTGIWMGSQSFNDTGFGPPPAKWKGKCDKGVKFTGCNNKVIGAQFFNLDKSATPDEISPADFEGHGTHTSSTAAGIQVRGANLDGFAHGTARGAVPLARIAAYKVCWRLGCSDINLLAAFDAAIHDNVDIISVSIGASSRSYFKDSMAIGSFHAMKRGILTSCSAGNDGPDLSQVENVAPWIMTVAATSIDRQFETTAELGNGKSFTGISLNLFDTKGKMSPLTSGILAKNGSAGSDVDPSFCDDGSLDGRKVKGKIVFCLENLNQDDTIRKYGGVGAIMSTDDFSDTAMSTVIPATYVHIADGHKINQYVNTTKSPTATIFRSRTINITAPFIPSFSSRGPQTISLNILKPDLAAPGLSILAAFSEKTKYNLEWGTSMSCPHAAGAAAYVKTFRPHWSPAAIKSALMTTAKPMEIQPAERELASGSGQINPTGALNPGLIYDIDINSYISFLCKEGYNTSNIAQLSGNGTYNCKKFPLAKGTDGLNYPSMHLQLPKHSTNFSVTFFRTVTNVGPGKAVYKSTVESPRGVSIVVKPSTLSFNGQNEKQSFQVSLSGKFVDPKAYYISGSLVWSDSTHVVKSPILVYRPLSRS
ncbi:subtilisin-like protease SBT4.15 [Lycium ferocissimum]|uniref:subtilisin-like protease SBT4.15 n=1 Tax=Lycium ferocissimum TaxID=112874 RepID=UPI002815E272|nr:subtilisin-like protease SBT4.15 [Lycium ferocissimum]